MINEITLPTGIKGTIINSIDTCGSTISGGTNKKMKRAKKTKKKLNKLNKSKKNNLY
jgi:hypothetical protein